MIESKKRCLKEFFLDPSVFRTVYFITLFASGIVFIDVFAYFLNWVTLVWAGIISINFILNKRIKNVKYHVLIILFLASAIISIIANSYIVLFKEYIPVYICNFFFIFHGFICFFILYGMHSENSKEKIKNEIYLTCKIILFCTTVFKILGFIIAFFKNAIIIKFPFNNLPTVLKELFEPEYILGIVTKGSGTRFEGLFTNPNITAFYCSVSLIFCHILVTSKKFLKTKNNVLLYTVLAVCIVTNFVALILSDSYASFIFIIIYVICILFYKIVVSKDVSSNKVYAIKSLVFILVGFFLILSLFSIRSYFQNGASDIMSEFSSFSSLDANLDEKSFDIKFGRPNHDLSSGSGRKILLNQAYIIFKNKPIIGVGPSTIWYYGEKYFENGLIFPNFHNGYVSILVSYGIVGFALFMAFLILVFSKLFLFLFKNKKSYDKIYPLLFSALISYLVFALFEKTMLSENNFMCAFFWLILGYATTFAFNASSSKINGKK